MASVAVPASQALVLDTGTLSIVGTGQLNLKDNDLIVRTGSLATITGYITTGLYNGPGGYWDGPGINSSVAAANGLRTAIGVVSNSDTGYGMWPLMQVPDGFGGFLYPPAPDAHTLSLGTEILAKYTYFGDADLNGYTDDGVDYQQYLLGLGSGGALTGWIYGDFDYSGLVDDGQDYQQYLLGLNQSPALVSQGAGLSSVSQVPEPSSIGMILIGTLGFLSRRTRKSLH